MKINPKIHLIGNAHLDPIWLWRWQEGCGEVLQTFRSALDRLNEYPELIFTCSSAAYYKWVSEIDPDMFEEIAEMVKKGRWVPVNGWWVQPDCNMPSGESFARQSLYSQYFYYKKFGKICRTGYNVDSFGHNGNLPQLLRQGGMTNYVMMRPGSHENAQVPVKYLWESQDGSKVLTYRIPTGYAESGKRSLDSALEKFDNLCEETDSSMMLFYGVGNHGGGPTKADIEYLSSLKKRENKPALKFSSPDEFFSSLCLEMPDLPIWKDELQHHASGCYSATSLVKQLNRQAENLLYASEAFSTVAAKTAGMKEKTKDFETAWEEVCFNQFHDILCGCSIMEAYEDVKLSMGHAMNLASKAYNEAVLRIAKNIDTWVDGVSDARHHSCGKYPRPVIVFNPLSFDIKVPVRTYHPSTKVCDSDGNEVIFQNVRSSRSNDSHLDTCFIAEVPAMGYNTYWLTMRENEDSVISKTESAVKADGLTMENDYIKVSFDEKTGSIKSLISKANGFDYAAEDRNLAVPTVIDDHKTDTWAHMVFKFHDKKGVMDLADIELIENGPARAVIRTHHTFGTSVLTQDFILAAKQKTLRVKCKANWNEKFTMLKMSFPVDGTDIINTYEIPAGYIKRPANGEEEPAQRWGGISFTNNGKRYGLQILNDSKYSYDCPDNDMRITLIRNVIFADHYSHRPAAEFNFTDEGLQRFEYGIYLHENEPEASCVVNEAAMFNIRPVAIPEGYHKGEANQKKSFLKVSHKNLIVTALKFAEDESGAAIIRLYESKGIETRGYITCDMLDCSFRVDFLPHEIKTFRIEADGSVSQVNFLEGCC